MNSRYLVFLSSTFKDLETERRAVTEAILSLHWFPSGMEIFPASNTTPWSLIERMIKDADYYVLIIGGKYGSTDGEGISYTEREYDLAVAEGVPVLAFLPANPESIPRGKTEQKAAVRKKLEAFQNKVRSHHCKFWESVEDLKSKVVVSLIQESVSNPRSGWVKKDERDSAETLRKLSNALEENIKLRADLLALRASLVNAVDPSLSQGDDEILIKWSDPDAPFAAIAWRKLWTVLGPILLVGCEVNAARRMISPALREFLNAADQSEAYVGLFISVESWEAVIYQFIALGLVSPTTVYDGGDSVPGYSATEQGVRELALSHAIRKDLAESKVKIHQPSP
jgi:hypothetical protein